MIPATNTDINLVQFEVPQRPSRTYGFNMDTGRVRGYVDGIEAVKQAIFLILSTERYQYPIYSFGYGVELADLLGQPIPYVLPEIKRRVTEALLMDDRITDVDGWEFETLRGKVRAIFTAHTIYGEIATETEVMV